MNNTLIFATHNSGKLQEIRNMLEDIPQTIQSLEEIGIMEEIEETGTTLKENAALKAQFAVDRTDLPALADDSGLFIDALDGAPGIYSARWGGKNTTGDEAVAYTLKKLQGVPPPQRTASFKGVIAYITPDGEKLFFDGTIPGILLTEPRGTANPRLPYDRLFVPNGHTQTFAQMTHAEKNAISHRSQAIKKFKAMLLDSQRI